KKRKRPGLSGCPGKAWFGEGTRVNAIFWWVISGNHTLELMIGQWPYRRDGFGKPVLPSLAEYKPQNTQIHKPVQLRP
ncbi:MAG: hypothetical protein KAJ55_09495, partial [Anaerolineales bacterium]|nr:hypothetical protein [Anaerolineales bacterium]